MRVRTKQRGQAIVEFGIVSLIFVLLMFAVVDLGLMLNSWVRLSAGAREIARGASVGYTAADLRAMAAALVLPGVSIGHGAVVAAASVVAADVPPYTIVAGNPARVVRCRFDDDGIARLLRAAWWDWPISLVTEHARTIMAGSPADVEAIAGDHDLLPR